MDELTEARIRIRLCELKVLAARTTVAAGEIADLIYEARSEPVASLVCKLLIERGLLTTPCLQERPSGSAGPLEWRQH